MFMSEDDNLARQIAEAERERARANERLGAPSVTERDVLRRNQADRRLKELQDGRGARSQ